MDKLTGTLILVFLCSCESSYKEPHLEYQAVVDPERPQFEEIKDLIEGVASQREMIVKEGSFSVSADRNFVRVLYANETAALEHRAVLWIRGHFNRYVNLSFYSGGDMPLPELEAFADGVRGALEREIGLDFCRYDIELGFCSDDYARREAVRRTSIVPEGTGGFVRREPCLQFRARYDPTARDEVRRAVFSLSRQRGLGFFSYRLTLEHAEMQKTIVNLVPRRKGQSSRRAILELSNEVVATSLELTVYDDASLWPGHAAGLADEAKAVLSERLGLRFCRVNPATLLCDERYAALETRRVASGGGCGTLPIGRDVKAGPDGDVPALGVSDTRD